MSEDLRPPGEPREAAATASAAGESSSLKLWILLGVVLASLLIVLLVLPSFVSDTVSVEPAALTVPEQNIVAVVPPDTAAAERLRADAEQALQAFLHLQAQPDLQAAEIWVADDWRSALDTATRGDQEFGQRKFALALASYLAAGKQLQNILDNRAQILQQNLAAGWQYLQDNDVEQARAAFETVIAMQAGHQQARLGLERTLVRDEVLALVLAAEQAVVSGHLQLAAQAYSRALQLDMLYLPAQQALEEISLELENLAFQDTMGRALKSLDSGDFAQAGRALSEAAKIRPGDPAIGDASERLKMARRSTSLGDLRNEAEQLAANENWAGAAMVYRRALGIDAQAAFAGNGLVQAQDKLQLHRQVDHYLADETRLFSDQPLENARKLLAANRVDTINEPLLAKKLEKLQTAVTQAAIPIELLLISDNLTEVTIYKVGSLGSFEQKQLSLRPGNYTITGSRQGYRDVLKVIELRPGMKVQTMQIRTGEQI